MRPDPRLHGLYVITDEELCSPTGIVTSVAAAIKGGARIFQYRDKSMDHERRLREARALVDLCTAHDAILLVNDDVSLAREAKAHGVHLGSDDEPIRTAREKLGAHAIIGVSCYNDFSLAEEAVNAGANYIAFGSVFPSPTKPHAVHASLDLFHRAKRELRIPACAIGGINRDNIASVASAGAAMAAVVSALFASSNITEATRELGAAFAART